MISKSTNQNYHQQLPSNIINISVENTSQILAARAAAIAAANSVNAQILHQKSNNSYTCNATSTSPNSNTKTGLSISINSVSKQNLDSAIKSEVAINAEKEAEQKRLEEEMRKRRERIEKWRNEKKNKDQLPTALVETENNSDENGKRKAWNLEDEDDDEDEDEETSKKVTKIIKKLNKTKFLIF